jgi:hypothetical protein
VAKTVEGLTARQLECLRLYLAGPNGLRGNGLQCALKAGLGTTSKSAQVAASRLLSSPIGRRFVAKYLDREEMRFEEALRQLWGIATLDPSLVMDWAENGIRLRSAAEIPEAARLAIAEISETPTPRGLKRTVKFHDKIAALRLLAQLYKRIGPDTVNQIVNQPQGVHINPRDCTPEQLEVLLAYSRQLEALGLLPPPKESPCLESGGPDASA